MMTVNVQLVRTAGHFDIHYGAGPCIIAVDNSDGDDDAFLCGGGYILNL